MTGKHLRVLPKRKNIKIEDKATGMDLVNIVLTHIPSAKVNSVKRETLLYRHLINFAKQDPHFKGLREAGFEFKLISVTGFDLSLMSLSHEVNWIIKFQVRLHLKDSNDIQNINFTLNTDYLY